MLQEFDTILFMYSLMLILSVHSLPCVKLSQPALKVIAQLVSLIVTSFRSTTLFCCGVFGPSNLALGTTRLEVGNSLWHFCTAETSVSVTLIGLLSM